MEQVPRAERTPSSEEDQRKQERGPDRPDRTLLALRVLRQWDTMHARVRQAQNEVYPPHRYEDGEWLDKSEEAREWTDPMVEMNEEWAEFCRELAGISQEEWEHAERMRERERDRERRRDVSPPAA